MLFKCVSSLMQCNLETPCNIGWLFHVLISMHTKRCFQTPAHPLRHDGIAVAIKTVSFTGTAVLLLTATILGPRLSNPIIRSLSLLSFSCKWSMRSTSSGEKIYEYKLFDERLTNWTSRAQSETCSIYLMRVTIFDVSLNFYTCCKPRNSSILPWNAKCTDFELESWLKVVHYSLLKTSSIGALLKGNSTSLRNMGAPKSHGALSASIASD